MTLERKSVSQTRLALSVPLRGSKLRVASRREAMPLAKPLEEKALRNS